MNALTLSASRRRDQVVILHSISVAPRYTITMKMRIRSAMSALRRWAVARLTRENLMLAAVIIVGTVCIISSMLATAGGVESARPVCAVSACVGLALTLKHVLDGLDRLKKEGGEL